MKEIQMSALILASCLAGSAVAEESSALAHRWQFRFDIGGTFGEDAKLTEFDGPVAGGQGLKLSPGLQFDLAAGYRITPWLSVEGELGFTFNTVDSVGSWYYPNSALYQMLMMANVVVEYPRGRLVPFAGVGAGGVLSTLTFGNYYDYYYSSSDGSGTDFVAAFQAFGGVRYQFNEQWSLAVVYRALLTAEQEWDVEWWYGGTTRIGVDSVCIQSVCLMMTWSF
jgi:opacity protein-like surface antigen